MLPLEVGKYFLKTVPSSTVCVVLYLDGVNFIYCCVSVWTSPVYPIPFLVFRVCVIFVCSASVLRYSEF